MGAVDWRIVGVVGNEPDMPFSLRKVFTVASSSSNAATMSPFSAVCCSRTTTKSPLQMAASIIESPCTSSMKSLPVPVSRTGRRMTSSTCCSAVIGAPAAIAPTSGTSVDARNDADWASGNGLTSTAVGEPSTTSMARPLFGSLRMHPLDSSTLS